MEADQPDDTLEITESVTDSQEHNGSSLIKRKSLDVKSDLEDDLACSVCLMLAVQPTTLVCGHTSCRMCLAQWYFTSKTKTCPMCRQPYQGLPRVNIQIRKMTRKLYPEKARQREEELEGDEEAKRAVAKYDKELSEEGSSSGDTDMASFCAGILIAICTFVVIYLAWYWQSSDSNLLVLKPVQTWKPKDVSQWVEELTWAHTYTVPVLEKKVDGNMLLSLTKNDLQPLLNMTDPVHQNAFVFAIDLLREDGVKMPANLWEYKAIYPGRSLFIAFSMKDFPRSSLLYMYVYFYDDMFLPFVRASTFSDTDKPQQKHAQAEDITFSQWIAFFVYGLLVPEWLVIAFALQMFSHHFFTPLFVIATGVLYQILEYLSWISLFRNFTPRSLYDLMKSHLKQLTSAFMFMVLWPIIPRVICDMFFYTALYISPVQASLAIYNKFLALNNR
ncbi:hypothetical protein EGW08_002530 [Elysia chlorotica]|uniref:RING-type domain-containing protein n=1 Tax=Elysia chlorotica TaxID=188477 RepID=A0A433U7C2_ELYCH|nr:hypothetical protein EGW08_002530 [Elysia chlorotica]